MAQNTITIRYEGDAYGDTARVIGQDMIARGYQVESVTVERGDFKPTSRWAPAFKAGDRVQFIDSDEGAVLGTVLGTVPTIRDEGEGIVYRVRWDGTWGNLSYPATELIKLDEPVVIETGA